MARYTCERCKADCNTLDDPHICKDLKRRQRMQEAAMNEVKKKLIKYFYPDGEVDHELVDAATQEITKYMANRDLGVD